MLSAYCNFATSRGFTLLFTHPTLCISIILRFQSDIVHTWFNHWFGLLEGSNLMRVSRDQPFSLSVSFNLGAAASRQAERQS